MECGQCERKFASKYSLNRHKVTKHGEKEMRKTGSNKESNKNRGTVISSHYKVLPTGALYLKNHFK